MCGSPDEIGEVCAYMASHEKGLEASVKKSNQFWNIFKCGVAEK